MRVSGRVSERASERGMVGRREGGSLWVGE